MWGWEFQQKIRFPCLAGFLVLIIYLFYKCLGACENERAAEAATATATDAPETETDPLMPPKEVPCLYGAIEDESDTSFCSTSDDLYDGKLCVICYDQLRNCFFVPCGHCATCYSCAQRYQRIVNSA